MTNGIVLRQGGEAAATSNAVNRASLHSSRAPRHALLLSSQPRNRLANETSPYLLQHAGNPVDWHPWGEEALELARREDKPILLSIGYSACHWCHVMAHESFEDPASAAVMNELFVNIKVDREERPDLDKIYQIAHQMLTQRGGGWPLTMFLSPRDQRPFFGGTYFPSEPRYGMPVVRRPAAAGARVLSDARGGHREAGRGSAAGVRRTRCLNPPPDARSAFARTARRSRVSVWRAISMRSSAASAALRNFRIPRISTS